MFTFRNSFIQEEYSNYVRFVKKDSNNYRESDIEYLDNVECKLILTKCAMFKWCGLFKLKWNL